MKFSDFRNYGVFADFTKLGWVALAMFFVLLVGMGIDSPATGPMICL